MNDHLLVLLTTNRRLGVLTASKQFTSSLMWMTEKAR